eukprot:Blabericola_migrator_1__3888@NODE_2175_length_3167_cov_24_189677_g1370_i0_p1_GENE_NODE_2175_length_3167_cov_24_189677_g1370_i0NODE_2175_length_3167_cov_24_189677_g1370_i0_p1_ORF_typecomplete_len851_score153_87Vps54_N/PF10475_9/2_3e05Vps54/PF07928_12/6_3e03Vps54/PF07928_12/1_7e04Vps54/PF07928_12/0_04Vps53_N/PF04100_12/0_014AAA_13/PF13166_6/0_7AAA_13/PF13166_6/1_4e03AAA_13/PF13166_6/1_2e03_NODE_2175_length_3167_cov_24_189677_g1370_i02172553
MVTQEAHIKLTEIVDDLERCLAHKVSMSLPVIEKCVTSLAGVDAKIENVLTSTAQVRAKLSNKGNLIRLRQLATDIQFKEALARTRKRLETLQKLRLIITTAEQQLIQRRFSDCFCLVEEGKQLCRTLGRLKCVRHLEGQVMNLQKRLQTPLVNQSVDLLESCILEAIEAGEPSSELLDDLANFLSLTAQWAGGVEEVLSRLASECPKIWCMALLSTITKSTSETKPSFETLVRGMTETVMATFLNGFPKAKTRLDMSLSRLFPVVSQYTSETSWIQSMESLNDGLASILVAVFTKFWSGRVNTAEGDGELRDKAQLLSTSLLNSVNILTLLMSPSNGETGSNHFKNLKSSYKNILSELMVKVDRFITLELYEELRNETWALGDASVVQSCQSLLDMIEDLIETFQSIPYSKPDIIRLIINAAELWHRGSFDMLMTPYGLATLRKLVQERLGSVPQTPPGKAVALRKPTAKRLAVYDTSLNQLLTAIPALVNKVKEAPMTNATLRTTLGSEHGEIYAASLLISRDLETLKGALVSEHHSVCTRLKGVLVKNLNVEDWLLGNSVKPVEGTEDSSGETVIWDLPQWLRRDFSPSPPVAKFGIQLASFHKVLCKILGTSMILQIITSALSDIVGKVKNLVSTTSVVIELKSYILDCMCLVYLVPTPLSVESGFATLPVGVDFSFTELLTDWRAFCESLVVIAFSPESHPFPSNDHFSSVMRRALVELFPQTMSLLPTDGPLSPQFTHTGLSSMVPISTYSASSPNLAEASKDTDSTARSVS